MIYFVIRNYGSYKHWRGESVESLLCCSSHVSDVNMSSDRVPLETAGVWKWKPRVYIFMRKLSKGSFLVKLFKNEGLTVKWIHYSSYKVINTTSLGHSVQLTDLTSLHNRSAVYYWHDDEWYSKICRNIVQNATVGIRIMRFLEEPGLLRLVELNLS